MSDYAVPVTFTSFGIAMILSGYLDATLIGFFILWGVCWYAVAMAVAAVVSSQ